MDSTFVAGLVRAVFPGVDPEQISTSHLCTALRRCADRLESEVELKQVSRGGDGCAAGGSSGDTRSEEETGCNQHSSTFGRQQEVIKELNFDTYQRRYVALELFYAGWDYHGFASQNQAVTVEGCLFAALLKCRLIQVGATWDSVRYSRCGRTDKGVSALGQVVALELRSFGRVGSPVLPMEREMDYPSVINRALPADIRVLGWTTVEDNFSARFSTASREYKYHFVQDGSLDVAAMREAAILLVGCHDFRHFCKVDVQNMKHFVRRVLTATIVESQDVTCHARKLVVLHLVGSAFLWHQVRCIAAVLWMVGHRLERPDVVRDLLDIQQTPLKPQYNMAPEEPLLFFRCNFQDLSFRRSGKGHADTRGHLEKLLQQQLLRTNILVAAVQRMDEQAAQLSSLAPPRPCKHVQLLKREKEMSVEARFKALGKTIQSGDLH